MNTTERLASLEQRLASLSATASPGEWAVAAYRLGVALTEVPSADPAECARRAMSLFEQAAAVLDATRMPVEHARVLNAAGAAMRVLGDPRSALALFERACGLMEGRARDVELAAAFSNIGLVRTELGEQAEAINAFDRALAALGDRPPAEHDSEWQRTHASAVLNRAHAVCAADAIPFEMLFEGTLSSVGIALEQVSMSDAALQIGMLHNASGQMLSRRGDLARAVASFDASLQVFTRSSFPFQHAVVSFNRGRAHEGRGDVDRALLDYEAAAQVFDPRLHRPQWQEAATRLADLERRLTALDPSSGRIARIVRVVVSAPPAERLSLVRERMARSVALSPNLQQAEMAAFVTAALSEGDIAHDTIVRSVLEVAMELPDDVLTASLLAMLDAHRTLEESMRVEADRRLDVAIQELVLGPQRVRMRDVLYAAGWERP